MIGDERVSRRRRVAVRILPPVVLAVGIAAAVTGQLARTGARSDLMELRATVPVAETRASALEKTVDGKAGELTKWKGLAGEAILGGGKAAKEADAYTRSTAVRAKAWDQAIDAIGAVDIRSFDAAIDILTAEAEKARSCICRFEKLVEEFIWDIPSG